jgi:hypothetical protein
MRPGGFHFSVGIRIVHLRVECNFRHYIQGQRPLTGIDGPHMVHVNSLPSKAAFYVSAFAL